MATQLEVTREHIAAGEQASAATCPIAICLNEWNGGNGIQVLCDQTWVYPSPGAPDEERTTYYHSTRVWNWIDDFDLYHRGKPITIEVDEADGVIRLLGEEDEHYD